MEKPKFVQFLETEEQRLMQEQLNLLQQLRVIERGLNGNVSELQKVRFELSAGLASTETQHIAERIQGILDVVEGRILPSVEEEPINTQASSPKRPDDDYDLDEDDDYRTRPISKKQSKKY